MSITWIEPVYGLVASVEEVPKDGKMYCVRPNLVVCDGVVTEAPVGACTYVKAGSGTWVLHYAVDEWVWLQFFTSSGSELMTLALGRLSGAAAHCEPDEVKGLELAQRLLEEMRTEQYSPPTLVGRKPCTRCQGMNTYLIREGGVQRWCWNCDRAFYPPHEEEL